MLKTTSSFLSRGISPSTGALGVSLIAVTAFVTLLGPLSASAQPPGVEALERLNAAQRRTVIVRYTDGAGVACEASACASTRGDIDTSVLRDAIAAGAAPTSCYGLSVAELTAKMDRAQKHSGRSTPDLTQCFRFTLPEDSSEAVVSDWIAKVTAADGVEEAYRAPILVPPPAPTPNLRGEQFFIEGSGGGLGFSNFWSTYGVMGAGVRVVDIEVNFNTQHEDLTTARNAMNYQGCGTPTLFNDQPLDQSYVDHGTASLGMVVAQHNNIGIDGLAPAAEPIFCSEYTNEYGYNHGATILRVLDNLDAGDVVLLEAQTPGPNYNAAQPETQEGLVPVEYNRAEYDAIVTATNMGVVIVEAAGNGAEDLDAAAYNNVFDRNTRDSGAIIVCASNPPSGNSGQPRSAASFTNYGSRCDVQSYGFELYTTGYGDAFSDGDLNRYYTAQFGGTSGASPQITGAVALLQSLARSRGSILTPVDARTLLSQTGTGQVGAAQIGPLPNVLAAGQSINNFLEGVNTDPGLNEPCTDVCAEGLTCTQWDESSAYCLEGCEPFGGATCTSGGCHLLYSGDGYCGAAGSGGLGASCSAEDDCGANHTCSDGLCYELCSLSRDVGCTQPGVCLGAGAEFGDIGVCYETSPNPAGRPDGGACGADSDCIGGSCVTDWEGGYCLTIGCDTESDCNGDATCWRDDLDNGYCYAACTGHGECRAGYLCEDSLCVPGARPPCVSNADCGVGMICQTGGECVGGGGNNGGNVGDNNGVGGNNGVGFNDNSSVGGNTGVGGNNGGVPGTDTTEDTGDNSAVRATTCAVSGLDRTSGSPGGLLLVALGAFITLARRRRE